MNWKTRWLVPAILILVTVVLSTYQPFWETVLRFLYPEEPTVVYPRAPLASLVLAHLNLVGVSSGMAILIGVPLGLWVTRRSGRDLHPAVDDLSSLAQTFPPVAVLAIAIPAIGFGTRPTVVALTLFSLLPIIRNTVRGVEAVSPQVREAARGVGMSPRQILFKVELPLAMRVIMAGVRIAVVINIGTATIGAVAGANGLGRPIVAGLANDNAAFVLQGAAVTALVALTADLLLSRVETFFFDAQAAENRSGKGS